MMRWSFVLLCLVSILFVGCTPKALVKNCVGTNDDKYFVCDPVWVVK